MFGFLRHLGGPVRYEQPRHEPSRSDLDALITATESRELTAERERRIAALDREAYHARQRGDVRAMDGWLDRRLALREPRPAQVPVIPGRSS